MNTITYFKDLQDSLDENILYKNSLQYESSDWRTLDNLIIITPIQRKLFTSECVFDFDGISDTQLERIIGWLEFTGLKFSAWRSSETGVHIHYFTDVYGKEAKKQLVKHMSSKLEDKWGVENDSGPMGHDCIRAEYSIHPIKNYQKRLVFSNITIVNPINIIPDEIKAKITNYTPTEISGISGVKDGKSPKCMRYILSNTFSDGRKRLLFTVVSWYKGSGLTDKEVYDASYKWAKSQNLSISGRMIWAFIYSSNGTVGCRYRHNLLEELGVDINCEGYEK
jgi:hypothetical protein